MNARTWIVIVFSLSLTAPATPSRGEKPASQPASQGAGAPQASEDAAPNPSGMAKPATPRPTLVKPKRGLWPFVGWSYAKAYTYNFFSSDVASDPEWRDGHQIELLTETGAWNRSIRSEQVMAQAQALKIAHLVTSTKGSYMSSECAFFPRHAVVYFDRKDQPVARLEVCFQCDDLKAWPDFEASPGKYSNKRLQRAFDAALSRYKALFKELGEPLDWQDDPRPAPLAPQ